MSDHWPDSGQEVFRSAGLTIGVSRKRMSSCVASRGSTCHPFLVCGERLVETSDRCQRVPLFVHTSSRVSPFPSFACWLEDELST